MSITLHKIFHPFKNWYIRFKYGCGCCDRFSLYYYLAKRILPCLKEFKRTTQSYPSCEELKTKEDWDAILDKMIFSFDWLVNQEKKVEYEESEKNDPKVQEGLDLFAKWFRNLWQ